MNTVVPHFPRKTLDFTINFGSPLYVHPGAHDPHTPVLLRRRQLMGSQPTVGPLGVSQRYTKANVTTHSQSV